MEYEKLAIIFRKGMESDLSLRQGLDKLNFFHIALFLLSAIVLSKKAISIGINISWVTGSRGYEKFLNPDNDFIFHGSMFRNLTNFCKKNSIFSVFTRKERVKNFFDAIKHMPHDNSVASVCWIEFYSLYQFLSKVKPAYLETTGLGDRYTVWLSAICEHFGTYFSITQHGIPQDEKFLHKVHCSEMKIFDKNQIELFKNVAIENDDCKYTVIGYKSVVHFCNYGTTHKVKIGIATQVNTSFVFQVLEKCQCIPNAIIILMLHPLDKAKNYQQIDKYKNVVIERKKKYIDLDYVLLENSTIYYDYITNNFKGTILTKDRKQLEIGKEYHKSTIFFEDFHNIPEIIMKNITGKKGNKI